jgi:hypothetical protein
LYDINFFSIYKKKKGKSNGLRIFIIVFAALFVLANVVLAGVYFLVTNSLNANIQQLEDLINSPETKQKIEEANRIKLESTLTSEYLRLLQSSSAKLNQIDYLDTALLDRVRSLTPPATTFVFAEYNGFIVNLSCRSTLLTDPMDMYHAFRSDKTFASTTLTGITVDAQGNILFSIVCQLAGGEDK